MRLIRTVLILAGVGFLLPSPPETAAVAGQPEPQLGTLQMISSATSTFADVASFCVRQPEVCETAGYVAWKLEAKAKYSARLIYEWASDATSDPALAPQPLEAIKTDPLKTGSVKLADASAPEGQSTLKIEDLIPEWRGPVSKSQEPPPAEDKKEG